MLAHHGGRSKSERGSDIKVEGVAVAVAKEMVIPWINAQWVICVPEVHLEQMAVAAFEADNVQQSINAG